MLPVGLTAVNQNRPSRNRISTPSPPDVPVVAIAISTVRFDFAGKRLSLSPSPDTRVICVGDLVDRGESEREPRKLARPDSSRILLTLMATTSRMNAKVIDNHPPQENGQRVRLRPGCKSSIEF